LKWRPSLTTAASGRWFRPILATLIRRRFLTSARLKLRDQPNNADHQEHRPGRNKPRQDEKHGEYSEAVHLRIKSAPFPLPLPHRIALLAQRLSMLDFELAGGVEGQ
jgi:hypothetical protein